MSCWASCRVTAPFTQATNAQPRASPLRSPAYPSQESEGGAVRGSRRPSRAQSRVSICFPGFHPGLLSHHPSGMTGRFGLPMGVNGTCAIDKPWSRDCLGNLGLLDNPVQLKTGSDLLK